MIKKSDGRQDSLDKAIALAMLLEGRSNVFYALIRNLVLSTTDLKRANSDLAAGGRAEVIARVREERRQAKRRVRRALSHFANELGVTSLDLNKIEVLLFPPSAR